ncbi:MAG: ribonuclease III [Oscillospiraceae bacterium]|nr:ribonuclease III [Oscillospiraceae bacterium]
MKDYFDLNLSDLALGEVSSLGLAYIGDCVFELLVRSHLLLSGRHTNRSLHAAAVEYSRAPAQAAAMERLLPHLTEEELTVYRRGRNTHVNSIPKNADVGQYHAATGLECLFGWLYLKGRKERINELFARVVEPS